MEYGMGEAKGGVPLGGLGTGYVTLGSDGSFLEVVTRGNPRSPIIRPECSFLAVFAAGEGGRVAKVLENPAPFGLPAVEGLRYLGLFPVAKIRYIDAELPVDLSLTAFSPFVPRDARRSALPVALLRLKARNASRVPFTVALMLSWQGPSLRSEELAEGPVKGFTLEGESGGYAVAAEAEAGVEVEASPLWSREDARAFWEDFAKDGRFTEFEGTSGGVARALVVRFALPPGAERGVRLALAWFFPDLRDSGGKFIGRMYANWFSSPGDVAAHALRDFEAHYDGSTLLHRAIRALRMPEWLEDALINSLYSLAKNTLWVKDGKFAHSESFTGCPITETIVCRFNGSLPILLLFPDLELGVMRHFAHLQRSDGAVPFAFGRPEFFDRPYYDTQKSLNSSEFVLMVYRDYLFTRDESFLRELYPSVKRAVRYAQTLDTDGDCLVNEVSMQYYDQWRFYGTSAYVAGIWLAALRAAEEMAEVVGDGEFAAECREWFSRGRESYERKLWNGKYYRLYSEPETGRVSEACLCNQLMGQLYAYLLGLGDLLPREHVVSALKSVLELNARATELGAVSGVRPDGTPEPGPHSETVIFGEVMNFAATCLYVGLREEGLEVARRAYENVRLRQKSPWNVYFSYNRETGEPVWGSNYYSNMCVWHLLPAWLGVDIGELRGLWDELLDRASREPHSPDLNPPRDPGD